MESLWLFRCQRCSQFGCVLEHYLGVLNSILLLKCSGLLFPEITLFRCPLVSNVFGLISPVLEVCPYLARQIKVTRFKLLVKFTNNFQLKLDFLKAHGFLPMRDQTLLSQHAVLLYFQVVLIYLLIKYFLHLDFSFDSVN